MNKNFFVQLMLSSALCAGSLFLPSLVLAQSDDNRPLKIGYVNANDVVSNAPQARIALNELTQKYSARESELLDLESDLREMEEKLSDPENSGLSDTELEALRSEARALGRELERASADLNEDYNFDRNARLQELQNLISGLILQMAEEEGFDLIVQSPVVWASPRIDITDEILQRLEALAQQ